MASSRNTTRPIRRTAPPVSRKLDQHQIMVFMLWVAGTVTLLIGCTLVWFDSLHLPDITTVHDYRPEVASRILDRYGRPLDVIGKKNRILLSLEDMPPLLSKAFVAAQDSRYWEHPKLDFWSILRAAKSADPEQRDLEGSTTARTITQQVAQSLLSAQEKIYGRKFAEAILSYRLERMLKKEEILYLYLNEIYLGEGAYGVEAAANTYFNKSARRLNQAEIALLAGLPPNPDAYSPMKNPRAAKTRQDYVLKRLADEKLISGGVARRIFKQPLHYAKGEKEANVSASFSQYITQLLLQKYTKEELDQEGVTVYSTLDADMQKKAIAAVQAGSKRIAQRHKDRPAPQGALVAIDSTRGYILALVGSTSLVQSDVNWALQSSRQPGSVFKPLIYATALNQGIRPDTLFNDAPLAIKNHNGTVWAPKNFDSTHHGPITMAQAMISSNNIVAIMTLQKTGISAAIKTAKRAGITAKLEPDLSLALGTSPVSLLEMTGAYTAFANKGRFRPPVAIVKVVDKHGKSIRWPRSPATEIMTRRMASEMTTMLQQVITQGTGKLANTVVQAAGKTGTSNNNQDAWFIGYTPRLTTGIWFGHDQESTLGPGETGGKAAAPIWASFMQEAQ